MTNDYDYLFNDFLYRRNRIILDSDSGLKELLKDQVVSREHVYTKLLKDYSTITNVRNGLKEFHKWAFFWLVMFTGLIVIILISVIMYRVLKMDDSNFIGSVPIIVAAFISLISTVIGIPMTITRFLFNTREDDNITDTIHHTQGHDTEEVILLLKDDKGKDKDKEKDNSTESEVESDLEYEPEENEHNGTTIPNSAEKIDAPDLIIVSGEMTTLDEKDKPYTTDVPEDEDDQDTADDPNEEFSPMI